MPVADSPTRNTASAITSATAAGTDPERIEDVSDFIDMSTFDQIREMDDEGSDDFSRAIVTGFLEQAKETFDKMDKSLGDKDLEQLSSLGHFLKGSSATLGLIKVKDYCEQIQHFGGKKDETGTRDMPDDRSCLDAIKNALQGMRDEYERVDAYFRKQYPPED